MKSAYLLFLAVLLVVGCGKQGAAEEDSVIIARVGHEVLTSGELKKELGSKATSEQQRLYVQRWLDRELLYQEAKKEKLHKDSLYVKKLYEGEKNLLSMAYLNQIVETESSVITDEQVLQFFHENQDKYIRDEDVIKYAVYSLKSVTEAWNMRKGLSAKNFFTSSSRYSSSKVIPRNKIQFVKRSTLSPELQKNLFSIKEGGITTPIRHGGTVNLYLILEKGRKGEKATFNEVKTAVRNRLVTSRYQAQIDSAMSTLRSKRSYTFNKEYFETTGDSQVSLRGIDNE